MNCVIDNSIYYLFKQGKKAKAIREYLREKYHIIMDIPAIKQRIKQLKDSGEYQLHP